MQCWQDTAGTGGTGERKDGTIQVPTDGNMWNFAGPQNVHPTSSNIIKHHPTSSNIIQLSNNLPVKTTGPKISNSKVSCGCKLSFFTSRRDASESTELMLDVSDSHSSCAWNSSDIDQKLFDQQRTV